MKIFLFAAISFIASGVSSDRVKRGLADEKRKMTLDSMNEFRQRFAADPNFPIANMQELVYDIELEKEAESIFHCPFRLHSDAPYQLHAEPDRATMNHFKRIWTPEFLSYRNDTTSLFRVIFRDLVKPLQTRIGCAYVGGHNCLFHHARDIFAITGSRPIFAKFCLLAPQTTKDKRKPGFVSGPPGSKCPNGVAESGLCKTVLPK